MASSRAMLRSLSHLRERLERRPRAVQHQSMTGTGVQVQVNGSGNIQVGGDLVMTRASSELPQVAAKPCKGCGTYVLGSPEKCPHCADPFDYGRPRLGSRERPHDCREPRAPASQHVKEARAIARVAIGKHERLAQIEAMIDIGNRLYGFEASDPARWVGTNDPNRKPPGGAWKWHACDLTKAGGQWYRLGSGPAEAGNEKVDAVAVPDERRPAPGGPIHKLLGYLIRTWLRAWLEGRQ